VRAYIAAPWRESYVTTVHQAKGCVFCRARRAEDDGKAYVLHRGEHSFIILNKFPYLPGHLLIAPYRHLAALERCPKAVSDEMADLLKLCLRVLRRRYRPQGFNIGMNLGRSAGAGVVDHVHLHVVPRWSGDANFMPIVGRTKVVIEDLETTWARLRPLFAKERSAGRRGRSSSPSQR
jgi:ATP adenylyltransferase